MNCHQGDLALVVAGWPRINIGRVIRVTRLAALGPFLGFPDSLWMYEGELLGNHGKRAPWVADDCLKPLRGAEETALDEPDMARIFKRIVEQIA